MTVLGTFHYKNRTKMITPLIELRYFTEKIVVRREFTVLVLNLG